MKSEPCDSLGKAQKVRASYRGSVQVFRRFVADHPGVALYHRELSEALLGLALTRGLEGNPDGQHQALEESLRHARKAVELGPSVELHRYALRVRLFNTADAWRRQGRYEEAFALASELGEAAFVPFDYLTAAALLSACARLAGQAPGPAPARRAELVETYYGG